MKETSRATIKANGRTPFYAAVSSPYGAPMGRVERGPASGKVYLARVRIDSGGYDPGGAYWGIGMNLYCAWNDDCEVYFRAPTREAAKAKLPDCTFYM